MPHLFLCPSYKQVRGNECAPSGWRWKLTCWERELCSAPAQVWCWTKTGYKMPLKDRTGPDRASAERLWEDPNGYRYSLSRSSYDFSIRSYLHGCLICCSNSCKECCVWGLARWTKTKVDRKVPDRTWKISFTMSDCLYDGILGPHWEKTKVWDFENKVRILWDKTKKAKNKKTIDSSISYV